MTDLISLASGKLNDPILMDWAIRQYSRMGTGLTQKREAMEQAWFDELTLRRWLDSDNEDILTHLFVNLPAQRFAKLGQAIGEHWPQWSGNLTYHSAPVLAQYQPDLASKCFTEPQGGQHRDVEFILGVIRSLPMLPPADGLQLLQVIAHQTLRSSAQHLTRELKLSELLPVSLELDRDLALEVIAVLLNEISDDREFNMLLEQVTWNLCGHSVYQQLATDIRQGETRQSFQQLAAFFQADAPLEQLDQLSGEEANPDVLLALVDRFVDEKDCASVRLIFRTTSSKDFTDKQDKLTNFIIGVVAAACEHKTLDAAEMSLQQTVQLLASDLSEPRFFKALFARLNDFNQDEAASILVETIEWERHSYGSVCMAEAMGQLGWDLFIVPLTDAMSDDCGDFLCEAAQEALVRIGATARDHLIRDWDRLDESQQIYGLSVIEMVGGEAAAAFAFDRFEALFQDDPERWCQLALAVPERRLLDLLEPQLPRKQWLFDETFYQLARLLDVQHPELHAVAERVQKAQAEKRARMAAFERGDWFSQTLMLQLKCPVCGDTNQYEVQHVAVNPDSDVADLLLADEFPCASCGRWVDFEFTTNAHLAITAELFKLAADSDKGLAGQSKALIRGEVPYNGKCLTLNEVVTNCKAAIDKNPNSIVDWLRLGLCYHQFLSRPRHGLGYAERALQLEPNAVEAIVQKAHALALRGNQEKAFELLDQALTTKAQWRFFLADVQTHAQLIAQFASLYNDLLRRLGRFDRVSLHAAFHGVSKKVGRNDPCPCGSGKKYKKCCLSKALEVRCIKTNGVGR